MVVKQTYRHIRKRLSLLTSLDLVCGYSSVSTFGFSKSKPRTPISSLNSKTSKFLIFCNSRITKYGRNGDLKEAEAIFNRMPFKNVISWTAMLTAYAENRKTEEARKLFDKMPERNTASWNAMITAYIRNNQIYKASELFSQMPERNPITHAAMITGFIQVGMVQEAEKVYFQMPPIGRDPVASNALLTGYLKLGELEKAVNVFGNMYEKDIVSWSSLVDGYCKCGRIIDARELFEKMPERNVVSWTAMIGGYLKKGDFEDGLSLFLQMREGSVKVNSTTLTVIFEACASLNRFREGIQVHGLILSMGFEFDVFLGNSLITMYCRCGCLDAAYKIFELMEKKDIVSWNSLISGCVQNDRTEEAYMLFKKMPDRDAVSWTSMIAGFSNKGKIEESVSLFKEMPEKDDIAWTAVISGFVSNGEFEKAFRWFIQMLQCSITPNALTLSSMLSASACLATLNQGLQIHAHAVKMNMETDLSIQNSLISMYAKCGNVDDAYQIFKGIDAPNLVSINSMITGFAQHGFGEEAITLFKNMQMKGYEPNEITFLGVLSACSHVGLVEEGLEFFKSMSTSYHIQPDLDHYTCMVDLLGRAGFLKEAVDLINSMPFKPHSAVWGALLSASRIHLNLDIAKLAAQQLIELEPNSATAYVVLSSMYSLVGQKKNEENLRIAKKLKGIRKNPGCSWVIINNKLNLFLAGDQSHVEFKEIKSMLRIIGEEIRTLRSYIIS
ncbi:PREDICTED: pentatricopeptide repeat-containing protein At1g53600, mitochondrial [Nelumbo nucifera]|uniref:Pentatricopeptide repeat-containing protein At1g53600, mitochondrial n=2 Tax=Nelumbo nucifera TaxID=4432 RepID=A0A822YX64_NELNU|nr:PREDICTED: pentatricopeptide repeat-containing protein At1g53600, mitochondrial [Nelumbo nucifera]DAD37272.1 TPA_asm: hypothetical protein HUJ06_007913 [Nelumbo nucifera]